MDLKKYKLISEFDGLRLEVEEIVPDRIRGIVQISHGMAEHKERYEDFMKFLAEQDYMVVIHDHRGHGQSVNDLVELGYFYTEDIGGIVEDLHQVTKWIKEQYPGLPIYLFSHSMGTLVARNYMKKYDKDIEKVILCGPPTKNSGAASALLMAKASRTMKGGMYRNRYIHNLAFKGYDREGEAVNNWLSTDTEKVEAYNKNPLCGYVFTNNGFINLFQLMQEAFSIKGWEKNHLTLPILMIAGAEDPVIQSREKFEQLELFLKDIGYAHVQRKCYEGMRHELLNEKNKEQVYQDILTFIEAEETV
nr:alpha/beta hydrolase [uncultured Blautia sp.]